MRLLLDTHAFLWWATGDARLLSTARAQLAGTAELFISPVVAWEIVIKSARGTLQLPQPVDALVHAQISGGNAVELPVRISHTLRVAQLPSLHRDPFDRLLIAQAMVEGPTILTRDAAFEPYGVATFW